MTNAEALETAIQTAYDVFDDHRKRHPGHRGACQDDWPRADTVAHSAAAAIEASGWTLVRSEELHDWGAIGPRPSPTPSEAKGTRP